jgi:hypothetical protein
MVLLNETHKFHIKGVSKSCDLPAIGEGAKSDGGEEENGPREAPGKQKCEEVLPYRLIAILT